MRRGGPGFASRGSAFQDHADNLRDHVAGALQHHGVARTHILAGDLVLIVQRGAGDQHATDIHRLQFGHRGQGAGAADLDADFPQACAGLLRREFPGDGPTWRPANEAKPALQGQIVDLVDHAVDIVTESGSAQSHLRLERLRLRHPGQPAGQRIDREAPAAQSVEVIQMGLGRRFAAFAHRIGEQGKRPGGGDRRVQLAQAAGGGIARVGENLLPGGRLGLVQRQEIRLGHEHFAANFDQRWRMPLQGLRHGADGTDIGGDILALRPVAARGGVP